MAVGPHPGMAGLILGIATAVSLAMMLAGALLWRRKKLSLGVFGAGLATAVLAALWFHRRQPALLADLFLESLLVGAITYALMRVRKGGFSPRAAGCAGAAGAGVALLLLTQLSRRFGSRQPLVWMVALICAPLFVGPLMPVLVWIFRGAYRRIRAATVPRVEAGGQERQAVLKMVADGKVSSEEAAELLAALGQPATSGDRLPVGATTVACLLGALLIAAGFVLPWVSVQIGRQRGYQAGPQVGGLGWLILSLGLLPAVLACIPALDRYLRQGLLRLLMAATGLAFAASLAVPIVTHGKCPGIGLILVLLGFGLQVPSALLDAGLLRRRPAQHAGP